VRQGPLRAAGAVKTHGQHDALLLCLPSGRSRCCCTQPGAQYATLALALRNLRRRQHRPPVAPRFSKVSTVHVR